MPNELLTIEEATRRLRVKPSGLRRWVREGKVTVVRLGRLVRFSNQHLERLMRDGLPRSN